MDNIQEVSAKTKKNRVKWGFIWALACAFFWGLGYVPLTVVWAVPPFLNFTYLDGSAAYIVSSLVIAAAQAIVFCIVLFLLWTVLTGKAKEFARTFTHFKISKWFLIGCICGGPCAVFGTALAVGYIGADFAASIGLLSAVVGAFIGRVVNKEKLSRKAIMGITLLVIGGLVVLNPINMINNINNPASPDGVWLGYLGGLMCVIGWGLEGNFAIRALDVTDADSSIICRYLWESLIWLVIIFPCTGLAVGFSTFGQILVDTFTSGAFMFWMFIAALSLGGCYVAQYKAFPLLGVGRTLSIGALYVPVSIVALFVFLGGVPGWWIVVGAVIAVIGTFVMYWESGSLADSVRSTGGE